MKDKIKNVFPDKPDLRDRTYSPTLHALPKSYGKPTRSNADRQILDQGQTEACTGFAVTAMIGALRRSKPRSRSASTKPVEPVSPWMLYYFARRYADTASDGVTARNAMKAWFNYGVCRLSLWDENSVDRKPDDDDWIDDAFKTPLGAYFRVNHQAIPDVHAAISEVGVIFATVQLHQGWESPNQGEIEYRPSFLPMGGHAVVIVGYDEDGFWIQNSWGAAWGRGGLGHMSYEDWGQNAMDAWVAQLGVYTAHRAELKSTGLDLSLVASSEVASATAGDALLSDIATISAQQINPYIINIGNNGVLADTGKFATNEQDLNDLVHKYLDNARKSFGLGPNEDIDVGIYAHGGLTDEDGAAATAQQWVPALFAKKIFPIFIMWETGFWETLVDILKDALHIRDQAAGGPLLDTLTDWWDERLEALASLPGTAEWDEMKKNAMDVSLPNGGLFQLIQLLGALNLPQLKLHLIGHSAGAILHSGLVPALIAKNLKIDGVYFMAPACRTDLFNSNVRGRLGNEVATYTEFYLNDATERADNCATIYRHSLLYLVSDAFEHQRGTPILGMQIFLNSVNPPLTGVAGCDLISCPTGTTVPITESSTCTSHGGFSSDPATREAILARIAARHR
jgi:Papain family cysteine protease